MDERATGAVAERSHTVRAAGAVVWRRRQGQVEVVLVHRPRYDDWSLPKGKADKHEHLTATAVREVAEETGLRVALGPPLDVQRYDVVTRSGTPAEKVVRYWSADATGVDEAFEPGDEVDELRWVSLEEAAALLTWRRDVETLRALGADPRPTTPVLVLRHAEAVDRSQWSGVDDEKRPLSPLGQRQAAHLVPLLSAYAVRRAVSSPSERCLDTLTPYAAAAGITVVPDYGLTERGAEVAGGAAERCLTALLDGSEPAVLCTHRPVLPRLLEVVAARSDGHSAAVLDEPLEKGEVLVAHLARGTGRVSAAERHSPR